jgi:hypothetical protein
MRNYIMLNSGLDHLCERILHKKYYINIFSIDRKLHIRKRQNNVIEICIPEQGRSEYTRVSKFR